MTEIDRDLTYNTIYEFKSVKDLVLKLLEMEPRCRNDDKWLSFRVFQHYTKIYIPYEDFKKIPGFYTAQRARQLVQHKEHKFLPTDPKVYEKRTSKSRIVRKIINAI